MSDMLPTSSAQHGEPPRALRVISLVAVCVGVVGLAAATFVLSYSGIHAIAQQAGINPRLARGYPLLLDAMLVVVLAAVLSLRGAGVPSKVLAWLTLLALLGASAGADALHAAKDRLPARAAEITAAVLPWVLVFLAFVLLLAMLRHARLRRLSTSSAVSDPQDAVAQDATPADTDAPAADPKNSAPSADGGVSPTVSVPRQRGLAIAGDAEASTAEVAAAGRDRDDEAIGADLAIDADLAPDDPSSDETAPDAALPDAALPDAALPEAARPDALPATAALPEPAPETTPEAAPAEAEAVLGEYAVAASPVAAAPRDESGRGSPEVPQPDDDTYRIGADGPDAATMSGEAVDVASGPFGTLSPAPTGEPESPDPDMPVFHRISSSPVPPGGI